MIATWPPVPPICNCTCERGTIPVPRQATDSGSTVRETSTFFRQQTSSSPAEARLGARTSAARACQAVARACTNGRQLQHRRPACGLRVPAGLVLRANYPRLTLPEGRNEKTRGGFPPGPRTAT